MATLYGPTTLNNIVLPAGIDGAELERRSLQDGTTYLEIASLVNALIGGLRAQVLGDPLFQSLSSPTSIPTVTYLTGTSGAFQEHSEFGRPDAIRGDLTGHMLPLKNWDYGLNWTWDYFRDAQRERITADLRVAADAFRNLARQKIMARLLKRGDDSGASYGLGTSGLSPGFATAAASTGVDWTPPPFQGTTFTSDHEHYNAASGGWSTTIIEAAETDLKEHGHMPNFRLLISPTDKATVMGLTGFVKPAKEYVIQNASTLTLANPMSAMGASPIHGAYQIGYYNDTEVWVVNGIPQHYGFMYKPYGANSPLNPLRIYIPKPADFLIALQDPRAGNNSYPLNYLMLFSEFGVGVGEDRSNGVPIYVNNATWADGTIS